LQTCLSNPSGARQPQQEGDMTKTANENQGCLTALLRLLGIRTQQAQTVESLPYRRRDDFLSPSEISFYHVLLSIVGNQATVCPKVGLTDLFFVARPNENQAYRNQIAQKHLDFLLCAPKSMRPLVGIELDDTSHARADREERDEFVDKVFQVAGLPLLHVQAQSSYNANELSSRLAQYLTPSSEPTKLSPVNAASVTPPLCPKCGVPMVVRTASRGEHQGKPFYGCPNYPRCREMVSIG
jgi:hypothetical protein